MNYKVPLQANLSLCDIEEMGPEAGTQVSDLLAE
jgi:hypothetical protein